MKKTIGIDIGGMSIKGGVVDENGNILYKSVITTEDNGDKFISSISELIEKLLKDCNLTVDDIKGIGLGFPGSVDSKKGVIMYSNNLSVNNLVIVEPLKKHFNTEVRIANDANAATLGEVIYGAAKGYNDVVMFTLGTGVGSGIVIDKKLYEGNNSMGAEIGHSVIVLNGEQCTCGRKGCIEAYVSASALIRQTKTAMQNNPNSKMWEIVNGDINKANGKTAFDGAQIYNDETAKQVIENYLTYLGESTLNVCNIFRPEAFVIGGGISAQGKVLTDWLTDYCEKRFYGYKGTPSVKILTAELKNDAGIVGAAALLN